MRAKVTIFILLIFNLSPYAGEPINKKWSSSANCFPCHTKITKRWKSSRHASSHFDKNDLFKKTLLYIIRKNPVLTLDETKVKCAKCHNPRITISSISNNDKLSLLFKHASKKKKYAKILNTENMQDGINCVVCHNVDTIRLDERKGSQGYGSISFGKQGTMFGPFDNAVSPYHKTEQRKHFSEDDPKLCFACHYSAKNYQGLEVYATGKEYKSTLSKVGQKNRGCKNCHMSKKEKGVASNYSKSGETPKQRMVREHRFASVDNSNIINDYIDISNSIEEEQFTITLKNNTPHSVPTGYGLREILLTVVYFGYSDKKIKKSVFALGVKWKDKNKKLTIPHLAHSILEDTRLPGGSTKEYHFSIPQNTKYLKYTFSYRLINKEMAEELNIEDPFFLKEYISLEKIIYL